MLTGSLLGEFIRRFYRNSLNKNTLCGRLLGELRKNSIIVKHLLGVFTIILLINAHRDLLGEFIRRFLP